MKYFKTYVGISALIAAIGLFFLVLQNIHGMGITGLNEPVVWGAYVVNFTFFIGITAGLLMLLALFQGQEVIPVRFKFLTALVSMVSIAVGGLFITFDIGRADKFYYLIFGFKFHSPIYWDIIVTHIFLFIGVLYLISSIRDFYREHVPVHASSRLHKVLYTVFMHRSIARRKFLPTGNGRYVLFAFILACYAATSEVFVGLQGRPEWNTFYVTGLLIVSSLIFALATVLLLQSLWGKTHKEEREVFFSRLQDYLKLLIIVDVGLIVAKYFRDLHNPLIKEIQTLFPYALWIFLLVGLVAPLIVLVVSKGKGYLAAVLLLIGGLFLRAEMIIPAYFRRWLPWPGEAMYVPTVPELLIVFGFYGLGALGVLLGMRLLQWMEDDPYVRHS